MIKMDLYEILSLIGIFIQMLGMLLFGVTIGWFTLHVIGQPEKNWQLQSIVFSVFLVFITLMVKYLTPGARGVFLVGAAGAMIYWGLIKTREKPEKKK
jgi:xanthine/uracil permease